MGADISGVLQHKEKGKWVDKEVLDLDRNYALFGILAGVRSNEYRPIAYPRGLPSDFVVASNPRYPGVIYHPTELKYTEYDDSPGLFIGEHSHSWLTLEEIQKYNWKKTREDMYLPDSFKDMIFYCRDLKNWRICFGFDS